MYNFYKKYLHAKSVSTSTATAHGTWGLWFGLNAHERPYFVEQKWDIGSPFLYILKERMNYTINVFSSPNLYYCLSEKDIEEGKYRNGQNKHLKLLFSKNPKKFLNDCSPYTEAPEFWADDDQKVLLDLINF